MKVRVLPARELGPGEIARWKALQASDPAFDSPYLCPEFTQAVAAVRDDVHVGVLEQDGRVVGFFPHQRRRFGWGGPVGGRLCDVHGVIAEPGARWGLAELLRGCRLATWEFHGALASQAPFGPARAGTMDAHVLDLTGGLDAYRRRLKDAGSSEYDGLLAKRRKLERQNLVLEFVEHAEDHALLDRLIEWKSMQYRERGVVDNFAVRWTGALLHRILAARGEDFAGLLSVVRIDGEPAAIHMGMRSRTTWHWWFPRHDARFSKCSPGAQILAFMAERAPGMGLRRIDLGFGDEPYKFRFRTGAYALARGRAEVASIAGAVLRWRESAEAWIRSSPLYPLARLPGRLWTRWERARSLR